VRPPSAASSPPRRGRIIVVAGPSGVGKGSVVRELLARDPEGLALSVSVTTRPARPGEVDGVDYRFVDAATFDRMVAAGELLEWAEVFGGQRYGTPAEPVRRALAAGRDVILEVDVQGAAQVRERVPDAVLVLLVPPSLEELERRLRGRGTESEGRIAERLRRARSELDEVRRFDHVVVNDDVAAAADRVAAIIQASRSERPEDRP
jgi:guanylate kinase